MNAPQPDEIWTTRDGRKIAVGDMDEQHVRNTLRMILRNRRRAREKIEKLGLNTTRGRLALLLLGIKMPPLPPDEASWEHEFWAEETEARKWGSND